MTVGFVLNKYLTLVLEKNADSKVVVIDNLGEETWLTQ